MKIEDALDKSLDIAISLQMIKKAGVTRIVSIDMFDETKIHILGIEEVIDKYSLNRSIETTSNPRIERHICNINGIELFELIEKEVEPN